MSRSSLKTKSLLQILNWVTVFDRNTGEQDPAPSDSEVENYLPESARNSDQSGSSTGTQRPPGSTSDVATGGSQVSGRDNNARTGSEPARRLDSQAQRQDVKGARVRAENRSPP